MNGVTRYFSKIQFLSVMECLQQKESTVSQAAFPKKDSTGSSVKASWGLYVMLFFLGCLILPLKSTAGPVGITDAPLITITKKMENISSTQNAENAILDLSTFFTSEVEGTEIAYEVRVNSKPEVATLELEENMLEITFLAPGQTNVVISAIAEEETIEQAFVVGVMPVIEGEYTASDFDDPEMDTESYWNGSDLSGGFVSGLAFFPNNYNTEWFSWIGWAYSNVSDNTTPGFMNQYSAITAAGMDGGNYAVTFITGNSVIRFENPKSHEVRGFYVTNSTYAALAMMEGDPFSKKFGGETGDDPDWFKLSIRGMKDGGETDAIEYYLADFRFEDNSEDYIIQTWQWVELSSLGKVDSLVFSLSSTDNGEWGMNTPALFCMDNLYVVQNPDVSTGGLKPIAFQVYPNPTNGILNIRTVLNAGSQITIFNTAGQLVYNNDVPGEEINITHLPSGSYIMKIQSGQQVESRMIIKR